MSEETLREPLPIHTLLNRCIKRSYDMFVEDSHLTPPPRPEAQRIRVATKILNEYLSVKNASAPTEESATTTENGEGVPEDQLPSFFRGSSNPTSLKSKKGQDSIASIISSLQNEGKNKAKQQLLSQDPSKSTALMLVEGASAASSIGGLKRGDLSLALTPAANATEGTSATSSNTRALTIHRKTSTKVDTPEWHAPWKLKTVISGHLGWVRAIAFEPGNEWFATGSADRTIKIWDLASGTLKLSLTGHINCVRGLAVSPRHPYLFSAAEDKKVLCWDLEYNKIVRSYHGHLSGVYSLKLHPTLDVLMSGGRDAVCRVWDMRTKQQIHCLAGHSGTVVGIEAQSTDPQIITSSMDKTIRMWDLAAGKTVTTLTNHKKSVRAIVCHAREWTFMSGAPDNLKKWSGKDGTFIKNFSGHSAVVNTLSVNEDNVLVSGADNGSMHFWDYKTGYCFQKTQTVVQPGSLDGEAGIYTSAFDNSGLRLITGEADKTIKIWKEDEEATPETHPVDMKAWTMHCLRQQKKGY